MATPWWWPRCSSCSRWLARRDWWPFGPDSQESWRCPRCTPAQDEKRAR